MLIGPFIYAFVANVCYTLGWVRGHYLVSRHA